MWDFVEGTDIAASLANDLQALAQCIIQYRTCPVCVCARACVRVHVPHHVSLCYQSLSEPISAIVIVAEPPNCGIEQFGELKSLVVTAVNCVFTHFNSHGGCINLIQPPWFAPCGLSFVAPNRLHPGTTHAPSFGHAVWGLLGEFRK